MDPYQDKPDICEILEHLGYTVEIKDEFVEVEVPQEPPGMEPHFADHEDCMLRIADLLIEKWPRAITKAVQFRDKWRRSTFTGGPRDGEKIEGGYPGRSFVEKESKRRWYVYVMDDSGRAKFLGYKPTKKWAEQLARDFVQGGFKLRSRSAD